MKRYSLFYNLLSVSGITLISRIVGFIRDMLVARIFGVGYATDAFFVANKLPNLLRRIFAEGAFSQAFVPILAEYKNTKGISETKEFVASIAGVLILILSIIVVLGIVSTNFIIMLTAPGFTNIPEKLALTNTLLKITFPYIAFISIASLISSVLNTWSIFSVPAFMPTILNICFIVFALFLREYFNPPVLALAWAVICGGVLQLVCQIYSLKKIGMLVMPKIDFSNKAVYRVIKLMVPAIFAMSISQISLIINTTFASKLPSGSVSWMYYADRLMEFPTGVLGVALGTILLPSLAKHVNKRDKVNFSITLNWGIKLCLLLALPATVGLAIIAKELTMTLFMYGKYTMFDVVMTSQALVAYSVGLLGLILVKIFAPGFYANQDIKTPVKIAIVVLITTQIMNLAFIGPLKHVGLALSIGIGACINAASLCFFLVKKQIYISSFNWPKFIIKLLIAVTMMAITLILSLKILPLNFTASIYIRVISLLSLVIIAIISYFAMLFLLGFRTRDFIIRN